MEYVSEQYLNSSVKVKAEVGGETISGTGFIYVTSSKSQFDYLFTAKHTLMCHPEDDQLHLKQISCIEVLDYHPDINDFKLAETIKANEIDKKLIEFDGDLVLLMVKKSITINRKQIIVSDDGVNNCLAYAMTKANPNTLLSLNLDRQIKIQRRYSLSNWSNPEHLAGCSGSAILAKDKPLLQGFIMRYPTKEFSGNFVDAVNISFYDVNTKLVKHGLEPLVVDKKLGKIRAVNNERVINIEETKINGVLLNLIQAGIRLSFDCLDDWFHDPLSFVDLKNSDFLFDYFQKCFLEIPYQPKEPEIFYLPKSSFTLRRAIILSYTDRLYYIALVDALGSVIDSNLLPVVYSSRYNTSSKGGIILSGVEQWKKMMYQVQRYSKDYKYLIEIDILNFYDNVDTDLLCDKLLTICKSENDRNAVEALRSALSAFSNQKKSGLPQNNDASSLLATFYLNELDSYMIHQVPKYLRFMDDIKIFCHDEFEARKYLSLLEMKLRDLKLSLNGQKTKIIHLRPKNKKDKEKIKSDYQSIFSIERTRLSIFSNSESFINRNEAFHLSINLILKNIIADSIGEGKNESTLVQALRILKNSKVRGVSFEQHKSEINDVLLNLPALLIKRPWLTIDIVNFIIIIDIKLIPESTWNEIIKIVTSEKYNTYPWQCYHLWFLLAKHKIKSPLLSNFASKYLDTNDDLNRPVIAALMIYMGSIDENYRRIILDKYKNTTFIKGEFQRRAALITLRSFHTEDVCSEHSVDTSVHKSLFVNKDKELVFVNGEADEDYSDLIQMYSL